MGTNAWHEHCILRDDVRQGTLELADFAADLYAVRTKAARKVYRVPTLFVDLLKIPQSEGLSTLILLDEALMHTRAAVNDAPKRFGILQDFFQALTQAVEKVSTAAIVASLITTETRR